SPRMRGYSRGRQRFTCFPGTTGPPEWAELIEKHARARAMSNLPSRDALLDWIRENPAAASKREIARAFGIKGADRVELKRILRELEEEGLVGRERKRLRPAGSLPPVTVLEVSGPDAEGE